MALKRAAAFVLLSTALPALAHGQVESRLTTEVDFTLGRSTEGVNAAAVQIRAFGASRNDWRYFVEAAWGHVTPSPSDAFGAAYPYDSHVRPMEAYVEKTGHQHGLMAGFRAGRYRTPFGISGRSDHAYNGFIRAPLIRYGQNWTISNTFLDAGVSALVGRPDAYVEASLGAPSDEGEQRRREGASVAVRGQAYLRSLIVGVSTMRSRPSDPNPWATGTMVFHGVDGRWMRDGVLLRGEWISGRPFDGVTTDGGYLDASVHMVWMGPVTAVARVEKLDYDAGEFSDYLRRYTAGARIRVTRSVAAQVNLIRQPLALEGQRRTALDVSISYSARF